MSGMILAMQKFVIDKLLFSTTTYNAKEYFDVDVDQPYVDKSDDDQNDLVQKTKAD